MKIKNYPPALVPFSFAKLNIYQPLELYSGYQKQALTACKGGATTVAIGSLRLTGGSNHDEQEFVKQ